MSLIILPIMHLKVSHDQNEILGLVVPQVPFLNIDEPKYARNGSAQCIIIYPLCITRNNILFFLEYTLKKHKFAQDKSTHTMVVIQKSCQEEGLKPQEAI